MGCTPCNFSSELLEVVKKQTNKKAILQSSQNVMEDHSSSGNQFSVIHVRKKQTNLCLNI